MESALACFDESANVTRSDVRILFDDDETLRAHRFVLAQSFSFFDGLMETDDNLDHIDLRSIHQHPAVAQSARNVAALLCFVYDDHLVPGVSAVRQKIGTDAAAMDVVRQLAEYLDARPSVMTRIATLGVCLCCQLHPITKAGRLCVGCWEKGGGDIVGPLTVDMVLEEAGFTLIGDRVATAIRNYLNCCRGPFTCKRFQRVLSDFLGSSNTMRFATSQAVQILAIVKEREWCPVCELMVHNLMAMPGDFRSGMDNAMIERLVPHKKTSLRAAIKASCGHRRTRVPEELKQKCTCRTNRRANA